MMTRLIVALCALSGLAACEGVAVAGAPAVDAVAPMPTVSAPTSITGVSPDAVPRAVVTGAALDLKWSSRYVPNVPYVNTTDRPLAVYSGPDAKDVIARLSPQNGGAINACAVEVEMCSITFGADRAQGWVFMSDMAPASAS